MAATSSKVLSDALQLSADERVQLAEKLLESVDAESREDDGDDTALPRAWADEVRMRSREMQDGSVRGLSIEEARRAIADDER